MTELSRRSFLQAGAAATGVAAFTLEHADAAAMQRRATRCIVVFLTGGPSQLETWDPKPDAPAEVRGPFQSIATNIAGVRISEHFPRMASIAQRYAIVRTVHHDAAPVHEAGMQLLNTGRLQGHDGEPPHFGAVLARHLGAVQRGAAPFVMLPGAIGNMGMNVSRGQTAGDLGSAFAPAVEPRFTHLLRTADRDRYAKTALGDACARAVQLVEQGTRCVVVNMFDTVYDRVTWDCHADRRSFAGTLDDYRRTLCPTFDAAFTALLDDLQQRGLLEETLVVAMGEMGRTPRLNANGGRDHWPGCWSIVLAGGGVRGGQVVGASDRLAAAPAQRPVTCASVVATIYHVLGVPPSVSTIHAAPIQELFA